MPDILIRGMEMPKNCGACYLNHGEFCFMLCRKLILPQEWEARAKNCPLHELPAHGALIDRDAIPYKKIMFDDDDFYYGVTQPYIDRMPVIVPASEGVE